MKKFPFALQKQLCVYGTVVAFFLFLPILLHFTGMDAIQNRYLGINEDYYTHVHQQVFEETKEIDILFLGFCFQRMGVRSKIIQESLSKELGRQATVVTIGTYASAQDLVWIILRDLLKRRKVKMLVVHLPSNQGIQDRPHSYAPQWIRFQDVLELGQGMPALHYFQLYGAAVLAAPRNFLGYLREEHSIPAEYIEKDLGNAQIKLCEQGTPFEEHILPRKDVNPQDLIYRRGANPEKFRFTGEKYPRYQETLVLKLASLIKEHRIPLVQLHVPNLIERDAVVVEERYQWEEWLGYPVKTVGLPTADLFAGLSDKAKRCLFWDREHMNPNGMDYFTRTVGPTLTAIYRDTYGNQ